MSYRLVHVSDIHFGAEDQVALDGFRRSIDDLKPDAIAVSGDLTQRGKRREFAAAAEWLETLGAETFIVAGNHDTPWSNIPVRIFAPFARYQKHLGKFDITGKSVSIGKRDALALTGCNTSRGIQFRLNWAEGRINNKQIELVSKLAREATAVAGKFLVCHHPLYDPDHSPINIDTRGKQDAASRLIGAGVNAVLTGHLHIPLTVREKTNEGTLYHINAGTLSSRLRGQPASFNLIEGADGNDMRLTVFKLRETTFEGGPYQLLDMQGTK